MFYFSKLVWGLLQPSSFIALLFVAGAVLTIFRLNKRAGGRLLALGAALYLLFGLSPLAHWLLIPLEYRVGKASQGEVGSAAGIIVLGGAISGELPDEKEPHLNDSADRMIETVTLADRYRSLPVIFTGGKADLIQSEGGEAEADYARKFFARFGITPPRLILEDRSRNTLENAVFTAKLLRPRRGQRWVLVTSAFHMLRAKALFEANGFDVLPWPVDFRTSGLPHRWRFFSKPSEGLREMDLAAREWIGLWVSWLHGDIAWAGVI
jgi:uncharacterized SAM-binding protein YcdF (DUF218 family)